MMKKLLPRVTLPIQPLGEGRALASCHSDDPATSSSVDEIPSPPVTMNTCKWSIVFDIG